ncbi:MAG: stage II sporulation protein P [Defluviitaleaceae bacterium]|nr:stage II sporulation protein P [Defluviitaleaceae bacterium]
MSKLEIIKVRAILALALLCAAFVIRIPRAAPVLETKDYAFFLSAEMNPLPPKSEEIILTHFLQEPPRFTISDEYAEQLSDFGYLTRSIFLVDPRTKLLESDIDTAEFLEKDFAIDLNAGGPQVLIFHTHSMEMFADSDPDEPMTGVFGVGAELARVLEEKHGIRAMHHMGRFDVVDGMPRRQGSYERSEAAIRQLLADNPSIQVVIDLHRDGVGPHVSPMVTHINDNRTAKIMLVNGLSRSKKGDEITELTSLPNPYQRENLAFSFNFQLAANHMYPGLARRVYLLEYRYSLHMSPRSILLEVGAQNNTLQEALNAAEPVADVIAVVVG